MGSSETTRNQTPFEEVIVEIPKKDIGWHSGHWDLFFESSKEPIKMLPKILKEARLAVSYADSRKDKGFPLPGSEPRAFVLSWPIPRFGLLASVRQTPMGENTFVSFYPWMSEGVQHSVKIKQVRLWPSRLEAQIEADIGSGETIPVTFFDPLFPANRAFYKKDEWYQFIFVGFPYKFEVFDPKPILITDPEKVKTLRQALASVDAETKPGQGPIEFQTAGMAALFPREDLRPDDYEFQGPVKSVTELFRDMLGQKAWRVRVTVARLADEDIDVDLCLTQKILGAGRFPKFGDDVRGICWLQGYLWSPGLHKK